MTGLYKFGQCVGLGRVFIELLSWRVEVVGTARLRRECTTQEFLYLPYRHGGFGQFVERHSCRMLQWLCYVPTKPFLEYGGAQ